MILAARGWVGVPFRHQGRDRRGVDCVGLIIAVGAELGLPCGAVDMRSYGRLPLGGMLESAVAEHGIPVAEPEAGAVVLCRFARSIQHVALCTGPTLIHAYEGVGKVVEHGFRGKWERRAVSAWRLPGVSYE